MELARRFYTLELLPGHSLSSFGAVPLVLPGGEAEASAVVAPALASSITCHLRPQAPCSSMCLWHQRLVSPKGFCPCRAAWSHVQRPTPTLPGGPLGTADRREARPTLCTRYWGVSQLLRGDIANQTGPKAVWVPWDCPGCGLSSQHTGEGGTMPGSICPHVTLG